MTQPTNTYAPFYLRRFDIADVNDLYNALQDKRVVKHMATEGLSLKNCESIIRDSAKHWEKHGIGDYAVVDAKTGRIIGWAGFKHWENQEFELLVVLSPQYWGLGKVIYYELLNQAKSTFKLHELYVLLPKTRKSFRSIEKLGFRFCQTTIFNQESFLKFKITL